MKVFISWSGEKSRLLAEAIRAWLPAVIQNVKPFFTPEDVEKGARWGHEISKELESSSFGIFCLTPDNITKPWIMFEAGALSKKIETARICPILFGLEKSDLEGPLVQFQAISFLYEEMYKMLIVINNALGEHKLDDAVLKNVFDMWWPRLKDNVDNILSSKEDLSEEKENIRSDRDILEEVLGLLRVRPTSIQRNTPPVASKAFFDILKGVEELIDECVANDILIKVSTYNSSSRSIQAIEYLYNRVAEGRVIKEDMVLLIQHVRDKLDALEKF